MAAAEKPAESAAAKKSNVRFCVKREGGPIHVLTPELLSIGLLECDEKGSISKATLDAADKEAAARAAANAPK